MNKQQIFDAFDQKISKKAIQQVDGEWRIIGKDCEIEYLGDDCWDFFVCNRANMAAGVGQGRVNNLLAKFSCASSPVVKLTGEGFVQLPLEEMKPIILDNLQYFGIRKKQQYSEEYLAELSERLKKGKGNDTRI